VVHACVWCVYECVSMCTCMCIRVWVRNCMRVSLCVCVYAYSMCTCTYVCMCVHVYVRVHVCVCVFKKSKIHTRNTQKRSQRILKAQESQTPKTHPQKCFHHTPSSVVHTSFPDSLCSNPMGTIKLCELYRGHSTVCVYMSVFLWG